MLYDYWRLVCSRLKQFRSATVFRYHANKNKRKRNGINTIFQFRGMRFDSWGHFFIFLKLFCARQSSGLCWARRKPSHIEFGMPEGFLLINMDNWRQCGMSHIIFHYRRQFTSQSTLARINFCHTEAMEIFFIGL